MGYPTQPGNPGFGPPHYPSAYPLPPPPSSALPPTAGPALGLIIVLAGLLALGLGMAVLDWLTWDDGYGGTDSAALNGVAGAYYPEEARDMIGGYEHAYLRYLTWMTAFGAALTATLATWPHPGPGQRAVLRGAAVVLSVFGLVSTIVVATSLIDMSELDSFDVSAGPWVAVAGYGVMALGALLGPPRQAGRPF
ncbi:hypothetical protein [Streptomyces sp. NBC_01803]|uniref:hypothetical protein n=1 Tax=Streptomyces sp. NBC_01803 TaxID=2975946 RepID=UPI002DD800A2|nr:hypothetical protein [Streptomyces sp. NBC_01803]WSA44511.1 hypothetical protein OIE51_10020 [Streptomyces sp. NBC_01803]